jgi:hypothetical protein
MSSAPVDAGALVVADHDTPIVLHADDASGGTAGYGFEGGRVLVEGGRLHLFSTEMVGSPIWVPTALAHWTSSDGIRWTRCSSIVESTGDLTGVDRNAAMFSPMPVFNDDDDVWDFFFVSYRALPDTAEAFLRNHDGRVVRARSTVRGRDGIFGPYAVADVVLEPGPASQSWEGLQGTDSFFPYRVGDRWSALYGSATTQHMGRRPDDENAVRWLVGLAHSRSLTGPWQRAPSGNPLTVESRFIENPVVHTLPDGGGFLAVYDNGSVDRSGERSFGAMASEDGRSWSRLDPVVLPDGAARWAKGVRTPLGLVPGSGGAYRVYFTGFENRANWLERRAHVGYVDVELRARSTRR